MNENETIGNWGINARSLGVNGNLEDAVQAES
jgi:hypothetical protein